MPIWANRLCRVSAVSVGTRGLVSKFISLLISGIVSGAIYSMLAVGLTLTYTTTGTFNLGYLPWPSPARSSTSSCRTAWVGRTCGLASSSSSCWRRCSG
jgi:hypothetical protein